MAIVRPEGLCQLKISACSTEPEPTAPPRSTVDCYLLFLCVGFS
jgi:hypothetical protein